MCSNRIVIGMGRFSWHGFPTRVPRYSAASGRRPERQGAKRLFRLATPKIAALLLIRPGYGPNVAEYRDHGLETRTTVNATLPAPNRRPNRDVRRTALP